MNELPEQQDAPTRRRQPFCSAAFQFAKSRHFSMAHDWGRPRLRGLARRAWLVAHWLWLDAICYAVVREWRLRSRAFNDWCDEVDRIFCKQYDWPGAYTVDSGRDAYIDVWVAGSTPEDEVSDQVAHFED